MTLTLLLLALTLRAAGAVLPHERWFQAQLSWFLNGTAAWLVTSALGAWAPAWPVAVIAVAGGVWERRCDNTKWRPLGDFLTVVATGILSAPLMDGLSLAAVAVALPLVGALLRSLDRGPLIVKWSVGAIPALILGFLVLSAPGAARAHVTGLAQIARLWGVFTVGVTPFAEGEQIQLSTGAVAWWHCPGGEGPFPGVVFFHGNNSEGSQQPAAQALRRALLHGGFAILALDHPGFGQSPLPVIDTSIQGWNPLESDRAAIEWLKQRPEVGDVLIAGHSMGTVEVLRLLAEKDLPIERAVLFGSSLLPEPPREQYWYERFHRERHGFGEQKLPFDQYQQIRSAYYDPAILVAKLSSDHKPVLFVDFGMEGQDIVATRDQLFDLLPGPKERWVLGSASHYFTVLLTDSVLVGDTRPTRWVAERLQSFSDKSGS